MTQKNPVGWFEVPVTDLDRAEKFYSDFFGYELARQEEKNGITMSWFPMDEGYGAAGTLIHGPSFTPSHEGTLVYFTAPEGSVKKALEKAEQMGIPVLMPHTDIGEHGFFAMLEDSEGNRIALHSMNE